MIFPAMFPTAAPAPAAATLPTFVAVWFIARLAWLTPPAMMIQLATVGMVKYPNIPMIKKMMYTVFELSGMKVGSLIASMSRVSISTWMRASTELNRSLTGSHM